jgi:hypothetical protein
MGRPFFPHEAEDPDLDWLVSNFLYDRPDFIPVEVPMLPLLLLPFSDGQDAAVEAPAEVVEEQEAAPAGTKARV